MPIKVSPHGIYDTEKCAHEIHRFISECDPKDIDAKLERIKTIVYEAYLTKSNPEFDLPDLINFLNKLIIASARSQV